MKVSDIKKKIKLVQEAIIDLEPYKLETYKIILKSSLNFPLLPPDKKNEQNNDKFTPKADELQELIQDLTKLSNLCKINTRELSDILKFDDGVS